MYESVKPQMSVYSLDLNSMLRLTLIFIHALSLFPRITNLSPAMTI